MKNLLRVSQDFWRSIRAVVWTIRWSLIGIFVIWRDSSRGRYVLGHIGSDNWSRGLLEIVGSSGKFRPDKDLPAKAIYIANHSSQFDIPTAFCAVPHDFVFLSKWEVKAIPLLGYLNEKAGTVFVKRGDLDSSNEAIKGLHRVLDEGRGVFVFPEGSRNDSGKLRPFKKGAFHLAVQAGIPIVPMHFSGTTDAMSSKRGLLGKANITVRYGDPIYTNYKARFSVEDLQRRSWAAVHELGGYEPLEKDKAVAETLLV